jgi:transcriptional regulator GlxA family with amidase domain
MAAKPCVTRSNGMQLSVPLGYADLEDADAPLKTVAFKCGFRSATYMRTTFSRRLDVSPKHTATIPRRGRQAAMGQ